MNTFEIAKALNNATDEEYAEVFAYLNRFYKAKGMVMDSNPLTQEEMDFNTSELTANINSNLKEIIFSEEMDANAWWKNDAFFGRNTPKAKFLAQNEMTKECLLMETAIRCQEIFNDLLRSGKIVDNGDRDIFSVWKDFKDWCYEYEYQYYDTDDFLDTTDSFFTEKLMDMFPSGKEVSA